MTEKTAQPITGENLLGGRSSAAGTHTFQATNPVTGEQLLPVFTEATADEVRAGAAAAASAFRELRTWPTNRIADLLRACSRQLMDLGSQLLDVAELETGLPQARLTGERARTCAQFEMFADLVDSGEHLDVIIDHADGDATPPKPDLRRMKVGVGPVGVFGASNFPFAFSVPGGDTASALAAGCSVVIKAHPSHPATSELAARALLRAVEEVGAPAGTVNLVQGPGHEVGHALVTAEEIRSVGFTGSARAGRALFDLASDRDQPIPVHAEMGSINPVLVSPAALAARGDRIASELVGSLTMGVGQFCTSPGLIFVPEGPDGDSFVATVAAALGEVGEGPLLNAGIRDALNAQLEATTQLPQVTTVLRGSSSTDGSTSCSPSLLTVELETYVAEPRVRDEHFGPVSVVVRTPVDAYDRILDALDGQLTVTLQAEASDAPAFVALRDQFEDLAGRLIWNAFPTGVAVTAAMHHGGPYPATTETRFTSVGTTAIERFLRPVTYQGAPTALLPEALHDDNPRSVPQRVDGELRA